MKEHRQRCATPVRRLTVGVFDDHFLAGQAISELGKAGFGEEQIAVALRRSGEGVSKMDGELDVLCKAHGRSDAELGGLTARKKIGGYLPNFDPAGAGGRNDAALWNVPAASDVAGFVGDLVGGGLHEHEAQYYRDEWEAGRTIITVASERRSREALTILPARLL